LGNGTQSSAENPAPQNYTVRDISYNVVIRLEAINQYGCSDTFSRTVKVVNNCFIAVPSAFTPNNDGLNDYLYPLNAYKTRDLKFSVFNRYGQRVFYTTDWTRKWDGSYKGQPADPATYVWMLSYIDTDTGRRIEQKGTSVLIR
jgi:gliding motility-associated-like protein